MTILYSHYGTPDVEIEIDSVVASYLSLRVTFSDEMLNDSELTSYGNYSVTVTEPNLAFDFDILSVTPENVTYPTYVDLEITDCTNGREYTLVIEPDKVQTKTGIYLSSGVNTKEFNAVSELPDVLSVEPVSSTSVRVIFSKKMSKNTSLLTQSNYSFTNNLRVISVEQENLYSVLLTTSAQTPGEIYNLTVTG